MLADMSSHLEVPSFWGAGGEATFPNKSKKFTTPILLFPLPQWEINHQGTLSSLSQMQLQNPSQHRAVISHYQWLQIVI